MYALAAPAIFSCASGTPKVVGLQSVYVPRSVAVGHAIILRGCLCVQAAGGVLGRPDAVPIVESPMASP